MDENTVKAITFVKTELGRLISLIEPHNDGEWNALEIMANAHKALRRIDVGKLGQLELISEDRPTEPPKEQLPLPPFASAAPGEDSLNQGDKALEDAAAFEALPKARRGPKVHYAKEG